MENKKGERTRPNQGKNTSQLTSLPTKASDPLSDASSPYPKSVHFQAAHLETSDESDIEDSTISGSEEGSQIEEALRPNKWTGPSSTWRTHTEVERLLSRSLDQLENQDLALHLYAAHCLKKRVRIAEQAEASTARPAKFLKTRQHGDEDASMPCPSRRWTAWPLPPTSVPRERDRFGVPFEERGAEEAISPSLDNFSGKPSIWLEENIQGVILRQAKHRLQDRILHSADSIGLRESVNDNGDSSDERMSQDSNSDENQYPAPDILADDGFAFKLLRPSIRHTLAKIDDTLIAFRSKRRGPRSFMRNRPISTRRTPRTQTGPAASNANQTLQPPSLPANLPKMATFCPAGQPNSSQAPARSSLSLPASPLKSRKGPLRDWSQMIIAASFAGVSSEVFMRAAMRCSALFGEGMRFVDIHEDGEMEEARIENGQVLSSSARERTKGKGKETEQDGFLTRSTLVAPLTEDYYVGGVRNDGFLEPIDIEPRLIPPGI